MLRDKFVFSIRDLQVKERLLREEKLTLERAISMARSSEASKEQIKAMGPKEQNIENPTVNEIRAGGGDRQKKILRVDRDQVRAHKKESARFVVLLTCGDLALLSAKCVITARRRIILQMFAERDCGILAGKQYTQLLDRRAVITKPIY